MLAETKHRNVSTKHGGFRQGGLDAIFCGTVFFWGGGLKRILWEKMRYGNQWYLVKIRVSTW